MVEYKRLKRNLININPQFVDSSEKSADFFNIVSAPEYFSAGKNSFKIKPNFNNLSQNHPIYIEVLDSQGYNVFHHVTTAEEADGTKIIAVYVYPSTHLGPSNITFIGTSKVDLNKNPLGLNQVKPNNIKFVYNIGVDKFKVNDNDIIFEKEPQVSIEEKRYSVIEDRFSGNAKETTKTGQIRYSLENGVPKIFSLGETFIENYVSGTISFPYPSEFINPVINFQTASFQYSSSILSVDSNYVMTLKDKLTIVGTGGQFVDLLNLDSQPYFLRYNQSSVAKNITHNVKNYARIELNDIDPAVGNITRVKVFAKSKNDPSADYKSIYDGKLETKNILVDVNSQIVDYEIGKFTEIINATIAGMPSPVTLSTLQYWNVYSVNGAPTPTKNLYTTDKFTGIEAKITVGAMLDNNALMIEQSSSVLTTIYKDTLYELNFDAYRYRPNNDKRAPKLEIYASGSAFNTDSEYGKYLGKIDIDDVDVQFKLNNTILISPDNDGEGQLKFLVHPGVVLQNISIKESVEFGFTPKRTNLYVPVDQNHKLEYMDIKIQYFNDTLREANVETTSDNVFFQGGNVYIYGNDNIITGSTFLSTLTSSGVQLYANYQSNLGGATSGSAIQPYLYQGIQNAINNPNTPSSFGWGLTNGNPYNQVSGTFSQNTINMINECGSVFNFASTPPSFSLYMLGPTSTFLLGYSGSWNPTFGNGTAGTSGGCSPGTCGESYIKWDGCNVIIQNAIINGTSGGGTGGTSGGTSGTSGTSGVSGTSGTSGTTGTSGINGTSGTSGTTGTSGTSGTSGVNGTFGTSGTSGTSGSSGVNGTSGTSGTTFGTSGTSGTSGNSTVKAGNVLNVNFTGFPKTATITFGTSFSDANYAVTVTGDDQRIWTIQGKTAAGFTINSNSNNLIVGTTYWIAIPYVS